MSPLVIKLTETVFKSPTVELYVVPVIIPLKLTFLLPDVSKNKLNAASPESSEVSTSEIISAVSSPDVAV